MEIDKSANGKLLFSVNNKIIAFHMIMHNILYLIPRNLYKMVT